MTHELIFTSVSQGLEEGEQGFCVVAADREIPKALVESVSGLNNYTHLYTPDSEEAVLNPVNYSHLILTVSDTTWHILSRIGASGRDYRNKPNHVAHHIFLHPTELVPEGPAWLLGLPEFHFTEWLTPSVRFARGRSVPTLTAPAAMTRRQRIAREHSWLDARKMALAIADISITESSASISQRTLLEENREQLVISGKPNSPCPHWQKAVGDAGWAGVLAETIRTGQMVLVLFPPEMDVLPLFVEALALPTPSFFWKTTFCTYYCGLPEQVHCQWKGVPAHSEWAEKLKNEPGQLVIDLTQPLGLAAAGPYVEYARQGIENLLPEREETNSLFSDEFDTQTFLPGDADPAEDEAILEASNDNDPTMAPPILPLELRRNRQNVKKDGWIGSFLHMKSRNGFYLLYGATFLLVLFMLALVLDQVFHFGLTESILGGQKTIVRGAPDANQAKPKAKPKKSGKTQGKLSDESVQKGKEKRKKANDKQEKETKRQKEALRAKNLAKKQDIEDQTKKQIEELKDKLAEFKLPPYIDFQPPQLDEQGHAHQPDPQLFPVFKELYPFRLGLSLEWVPVLTLPDIQIETRSDELFVDTQAEDTTAKVEPNRLEGDSTETPGVEDLESDEFKMPDISRLQWTTYMIDSKADQEIPLFTFELTQAGLSIQWRSEGLENQHLHDTLWLSLAFLRVSALDDNDWSRKKTTAVIKPIEVLPAYFQKIAEDSADGGKGTTYDMFFAKEPWKTLLENKPIPFVLKFSVNVIPDTVVLTRNEDLEPSKFYADFTTGISANRIVSDIKTDTEPVKIPFEGEVLPDKITWKYRYDDLFKKTEKELAQTSTDIDELDPKITLLGNEVAGGIGLSKDAKDEQAKKKKQLADYKKQREEKDQQAKNLDSIKEKLPEASENLLKNKDHRFEFSVHLLPPDDTGSNDKLPSEKFLILVQPKDELAESPSEPDEQSEQEKELANEPAEPVDK